MTVIGKFRSRFSNQAIPQSSCLISRLATSLIHSTLLHDSESSLMASDEDSPLRTCAKPRNSPPRLSHCLINVEQVVDAPCRPEGLLKMLDRQSVSSGDTLELSPNMWLTCVANNQHKPLHGQCEGSTVEYRNENGTQWTAHLHVFDSALPRLRVGEDTRSNTSP